MAAPAVLGERHRSVYEGATTDVRTFQLNQTVPAGGWLLVQIGYKILFNGGGGAEMREYATGLNFLHGKNHLLATLLGHAGHSNNCSNFHWLVRVDEAILGQETGNPDTITIRAKGGWNTDVYLLHVWELGTSGPHKTIVAAYVKESDAGLTDGTPSPGTINRAEPLPAGIERRWFHTVIRRGLPSETYTPDPRFAVNLVTFGSTVKAPATENVTIHLSHYVGSESDMLAEPTFDPDRMSASVLIALEEVDDVPGAPRILGGWTFYTQTDPNGNAYGQGDSKIPQARAGDWALFFLTRDDGAAPPPPSVPSGLARLHSDYGNIGIEIYLRCLTGMPSYDGNTGQIDRYNIPNIGLGSGSVIGTLVVGGLDGAIKLSSLASGGSVNTIEDGAVNFLDAGIGVGDYVEVIGGPGSGQAALVTAVAANQISVQDQETPFQAGTEYRIRKNPWVAYTRFDRTNPRTWPSQAPGGPKRIGIGGISGSVNIDQDDNFTNEAPAVGRGSFVVLENGRVWAFLKLFWFWTLDNTPVAASTVYQPGRPQENPSGIPTPTDGDGFTILLFGEPAPQVIDLVGEDTVIPTYIEDRAISRTQTLAGEDLTSPAFVGEGGVQVALTLTGEDVTAPAHVGEGRVITGILGAVNNPRMVSRTPRYRVMRWKGE
jgi:hypothetical protein